MQWVVHYPEGDTNLLGQPFIKSPEQGAPPGEVNTVTNDIGIQFGRSLLQRAEYGRIHLADRFFDAVCYLLVRNRHNHWQRSHSVGAMNYEVLRRIIQLG